jgi:hypothetical protein
MYRVIYWFNGKQRFTAQTNKEDAVNTAKHFDGIVVKEVKKYYDSRPQSFRKKTIKDMQESNAAYKERWGKYV